MTAAKPAWTTSPPHFRGRSCMKLIGLAATLIILFYTILNIYNPQEARLAVPSWRHPLLSSSDNKIYTGDFNSTDAELENSYQKLNKTSAELAEPEETESNIDIHPANNYEDDGAKYKSDFGKVTIVFG